MKTATDKYLSSRRAYIESVKADVKAGDYDTDHRMDEAAERLLDEVIAPRTVTPIRRCKCGRVMWRIHEVSKCTRCMAGECLEAMGEWARGMKGAVK